MTRRTQGWIGQQWDNEEVNIVYKTRPFELKKADDQWGQPFLLRKTPPKAELQEMATAGKKSFINATVGAV